MSQEKGKFCAMRSEKITIAQIYLRTLAKVEIMQEVGYGAQKGVVGFPRAKVLKSLPHKVFPTVCFRGT